MRRRKARLLESVRCADDVFLLRLRVYGAPCTAKPGQFAMVEVPLTHTVLRRPFSIVEVGEETVHLLVRVKGEGTKALCRLNGGALVDILLPLGKGFSMRGERPLVVAGGIGIAPLLFLLKKLKLGGIDATLLFGASTKEKLYLSDYISTIIGKVTLATEDGSAGVKGTVLDVMEEVLKGDGGYDFIYACGPEAMLRGVAELARKAGIDGEASIETRMFCGVGVCSCCSLRTSTGNIKLCVEGPVVPLHNLTL